jgi:CheY-like chemotaxis protein
MDDLAPILAARPRRRPRVLVVNRLRAERDLYSAHLRGAGYDVQVACEGLEALARAIARRPDAIVMDLASPPLDAWEVTRRL